MKTGKNLTIICYHNKSSMEDDGLWVLIQKHHDFTDKSREYTLKFTDLHEKSAFSKGIIIELYINLITCASNKDVTGSERIEAMIPMLEKYDMELCRELKKRIAIVLINEDVMG